MRGSKAKKLRGLAFDPPAMKYSHNREYIVVMSPRQRSHPFPRTVIADNQRAFYQALKGRRSGLDLG